MYWRRAWYVSSSFNMHPDAQLFNTVKTRLSTALLGDVLDTLGHTNQFLPPTIRPLDTKWKLVGRAMPVLESEYRSGHGVSQVESSGPLADKPFGLMMQALDSLLPGEIYIASASSLGSPLPFAFWGGLMSTRARYLQCEGAILNGYARDVNEILGLDFPVWSVGMYSKVSLPSQSLLKARTKAFEAKSSTTGARSRLGE